MGFSPRIHWARLVAVLLLLALGLGCMGTGPRAYGYFSAPAPADPWTPKITAWQSRETARAEPTAPRAPVSESGPPPVAAARPETVTDLRTKYLAYRDDRRRALARDLAAWIQRESRQHYVPDGPVDHWATLRETLEGNGDDCDGLELLVFHLLRDLGFQESEVFRAIVRRPADGQHHMVTLWFEDPQDPWVIDPTGAMTDGMPRMSEVAGWEPIKVFSETEQFTVHPKAGVP